MVKDDLPPLHGDGSTSYAANEDDWLDRAEIFRRSTDVEDGERVQVVHSGLGDAERHYNFFLLHLTDADSQASSYGKSDAWNQQNLNSSAPDTSVNGAPWSEFIPIDTPEGNSWRGNSYKRAIARKGDQVTGRGRGS